MDFAYLVGIVLLILGFGFVIFWHELGHFIAAKWAGVRVEQFAIGFGTAICSWRKGMGFRWGSSGQEYEKMLRSDFAPANAGETEYRINWLPLGGYVKMLGQDDMNPNALSEDPRAYNKKSIGKRMVIVSAGVIMNVILAAGLFMFLFLYGFNVPPAVVPTLQPGSPAQRAGMQVGDRILYFDNKYQHDFTKISLSAALAEEGASIPVYVRHPDGTEEHLSIIASRDDNELGFLSLGIAQPGDVPRELRGLDPRKVTTEFDEMPDEYKIIRPDDVIVAIDGTPVELAEYWKLDRALQKSFGRPIAITVKDSTGKVEDRQVRPTFMVPFGGAPLSFGGLVPRATVLETMPHSPAKDKLKRGDVIAKITLQSPAEEFPNPSRERLMKLLDSAGQNSRLVDVTVIRDGQEVVVAGLSPSLKVGKNRMGLGISLGVDELNPVIADVLADTAGARAAFAPGSKVMSIDGQPVASWFDIHRILSSVPTGQPLVVQVANGSTEKTIALVLGADDQRQVASNRYRHSLALREHVEPRKTNNPLVAAAWGATETRDLLVQFYLTIKRMAQRSVPVSGVMGPVGIVQAGSRFAYKGFDWLIWFLAMISANLAVVNFLPIPIVDGGLFMFLVLEKIMGRPLSAKAQSIAQIVGLALILSVFIFVTYQDINRFF
jgi:regulator of sigma E protease